MPEVWSGQCHSRGGSPNSSLGSESAPGSKEVWSDVLELDRTGTEETRSRRQGRKMSGAQDAGPQDKLGVPTPLPRDTEGPEQLPLRPLMAVCPSHRNSGLGARPRIRDRS